MTLEKGFFTHLMTSDEMERGIDVTAYPSFEAAYLEVVAAIPEMAADLLRRGLDPMKCAFLICDENDCLLETVHFGELVKGRAGPPEPHSQDLLLPAHGCTIRDKARDACDQLHRTRLETQRLLAIGKELHSKINKNWDQAPA